MLNVAQMLRSRMGDSFSYAKAPALQDQGRVLMSDMMQEKARLWDDRSACMDAGNCPIPESTGPRFCYEGT